MKEIALLGYGIEGRSAHRYLARVYPEAHFTVYSQTPPTPQALSDEATYRQVEDFHNIMADLIVRTPAIAPTSITSNARITSVTELFFTHCPAPIIGVTGSKGKGTTSSFITSILRAAGKTVHLVGNIGVASLDVLPDIAPTDIVVYELSSYQLWDMKISPQTAVVLMIEPDHLDVHATMDDYVAAKRRIAQFQQATDRLVFYQPNSFAQSIAQSSEATKIPYPTPEGFHIANDNFFFNEHIICSTSAVKLPGEHNLLNALAAIAAVWTWVDSGEIIAAGLSAFNGLPHRLAFVTEKKGVRYYDDSIATTPGSVIAALRSFNQPKVVILGGVGKGADFAPLIAEITQHQIRKVLLIGQEGPKLARQLTAAHFTNFEVIAAATIDPVVTQAAAAAQKGDVVLLSPACASFDMFQSYADRGDKFIAAVKELPA